MKSVPIRLSDTLRKNGYLYVLMKRSDKVALYKQLDPDQNMKCIAYELFEIKIQRERIFLGKKFPLKEKFPSNEDFGNTAWVITNPKVAHSKYLELEIKLTRRL